MPNERYGFVSNRQEFAGAMVMGCSLQKKLREKAEWICKHCSQVFDDFEEARKHESIEEGDEHHLRGNVDMLDVRFAIKEVAEKIREQACKGNDIEDRIRSARNAYRRKDLSFETYNKIRDEKFVPLDSVLGLIVDSGTLETLKIMKDKKLMKLLRESRKKGSTSSPYKPLVGEGEK